MTVNSVAAKLTKKYFFTISAGDFLASNVGKSRTESIFAEVVASSNSDREQQWGRIVSAGADQRLCHVFSSKAEHEAMLASIS